MEQLIKIFQEIGHMPPGSEHLLLEITDRKELPAKSSLQETGKVCNHIYFVEKGVVRTYYYKDSKEVTYWIGAENDFVGSMASFFSRMPSNKYVETLEESTLWEFDYFKLESIYGLSKEFERMGRLFANYAIVQLEKRMDDFHFMSAKERYALLLEKHPQIVQRVSLGIIASFLGISQETLSRIRSQI